MSGILFDTSFFLLAATVMVAGIARGLSGFGTGLIVVPVAAALYDPVVAVVIVVIIDSLPIIPLTLPVLKHVNWREVLPVTLGLALFVPLGIMVLKLGDPHILRWAISIIILICAVFLWRGWRYHGPRTWPVSTAVGALSGLLGGIASIPGPPVIMYWMASAAPAFMIRANLMALFMLGEVFAFANQWAAGFLTAERVWLGAAMAPIYMTGLGTGCLLYGRSAEATYRRITFSLVVASALLAMPPVGRALRSALSGLVA
ncbi:sulfite exporter TauE/SafE family protein [Nitratireductor basaltis]|uniref:Probable membrane transporter protein n=1 Tax=Nitratireductor basaltis TaxID=472175 RepID=A0A084U789_9HYPH|nr:sulfite exporter TauE/SafE family protein [Nitratireductor basaltis]KFB08825.1 Sulfite exporter TauE/SafE [Nitratireductor basaltis]